MPAAPLDRPTTHPGAGWFLAAVLVIGASSELSLASVGQHQPVGARPTPVALAGGVADATAPTPPVAGLGPVVDSAITTDGVAIARQAFAPDAIPQPPNTAIAVPVATASSTITRTTTTTTTTAVWWSVYQGRNHVWMPTLGINRTVYLFACDRGTSPDNLVYRWGCAGRNNVYLLGHAYGVFKPLHDAYYNGRLKVGMPVIYADALGHVHLFRVTKWQVVSPMDISWSYALPTSSMTLQTCIGSTGTQRLNVRLVEVRA